MLDGQTLALIFVAILVLFGANKLPELARSMGKASGEFKKAQLEAANEIRALETPIKEIKNIPQSSEIVGESVRRLTTTLTDSRLMKLATDLGISTEGKDESLILDEIKAIIHNKAVIRSEV